MAREAEERKRREEEARFMAEQQRLRDEAQRAQEEKEAQQRAKAEQEESERLQRQVSEQETQALLLFVTAGDSYPRWQWKTPTPTKHHASFSPKRTDFSTF